MLAASTWPDAAIFAVLCITVFLIYCRMYPRRDDDDNEY